ncbi:RidA family protein [Deinococcus sp. KNUC1210]|uniref:RidA family protein n=1 Tax=Deinococcus sp. KNUC1210 TaxID=2917691 RepID=UPI001EF14656|nr:RidA family protein [Deinococcus sp. KNUC1210]ULH16773.1 RidA family protein [Deinococcus sp. KNUC1210]
MDNSPTRRFLFPDGLAKVPGYTPVVEVRAGRTVYISGQVPTDEFGRLIGTDDFEAQARQVFENLGRALRAAEMDFSHIVKFGIYLTDMANLAAMRRVRDEFIDAAQPPASTLVQVAALGHPQWLFEVDAVAVAPLDAGA